MQSRITMAEALFLVAAAAACAASAYDLTAMFAVLKPAATALAVAAVALRDRAGLPKALTLAALAASLIGDVLLMRADLFVFGLAAFLVAHGIYIALLAREARPSRSWIATAAVAVYGDRHARLSVAAYRRRAAGAGDVAYVAAISTMLALAVSRAVALRNRRRRARRARSSNLRRLGQCAGADLVCGRRRGVETPRAAEPIGSPRR